MADLITLEEYKDAENIFNDLIISNPKYVNAYVNLGNLKRDLNKFDEAIKTHNLNAILYDDSY